MVKPKNSFEAMARKAAARLDEARAAGEQLSLLPEPELDEAEAGEGGKVGRSKGKATNQMREWLASKGYRMPEDVLAEMAGLSSSEDAVLVAMQRAELVIAWAYDGATKKKKGGGTEEVMPTPAVRLSAFQQLYVAMLRAADALLPYGAPKASPDQVFNQTVQVVVPAAPCGPRDVTPQTPRIEGRMVPADVAAEIEQKQSLADDAPASERGGIRTDGAND